MPSRYWVGGTASWDGTAGSKWAATSGGAGGESVPTTADDVFFDANSSGTVTIAAGNTGAKSINCTGFTGGIAGSTNITVAGSITLDAGQSYTHTGTVTITGTGTLTTAGKTFSRLTISGVGITVTLGDALNIGGRILTVSAGTFDTAGFAVTAESLVSSSSTVRSIFLGASTLTVTLATGTPLNFSDSTNLTFTAGTSQINVTGATSVLTVGGGGNTFYNLAFTGSGAANNQRTLTGQNTFNDLSLTASANGFTTLVLSDDQTVTGTLTCAGTSVSQRGLVRSNSLGVTRTVTAAVVSADDCDFRDITIAGAAAPISPTRAGDCGGNSGITFPAPKTVYRVGTDSNWQGSNSWALTSGGTGANANLPLAQDTAVFDNSTTGTSISLSGSSAGGHFYNLGTLDASARTTGYTIDHNRNAAHYGDYTLGSGVTTSGTSTQDFAGRGTQTFTSAGKTISFLMTISKISSTFILGDALTLNTAAGTRTIILNVGTFDANDYSLTCSGFLSSNGSTRTITMGSGLWTLAGAGTTAATRVWDTDNTTNLTFNKDTADILLSNTTTTARNFFGGGLSYNKLTIGGATGTSVTTIAGTNSFTELASTKTVAHTIRFSSDQGAIDTWSVTGTSGNVVTVDSSVAGTRRTFSLTNSTEGTVDFMDVKDIGVVEPNRFFVGDNSTDSGNNLNVIFSSAPVAATGNMLMLFA
jgi:hypothetical protein